MKKLLFVDACIRLDSSRTRSLAKTMLKKLEKEYEISTINLSETDILPVNHKRYIDRQNGILPQNAEQWSHMAADADLILIAAPFWDMSFPSVLKVFFEQASIPGITFCDTPSGEALGACRAEKMIFVTTRGMDIETGSEFEQATPYLKAICFLWGIKSFECISACGMDTVDDVQREMRLSEASKEGTKLCEEILK